MKRINKNKINYKIISIYLKKIKRKYFLKLSKYKNYSLTKIKLYNNGINIIFILFIYLLLLFHYFYF